MKLFNFRNREPAAPGMQRIVSRGGGISFELPLHWKQERCDGSTHFFDPVDRNAFLMMGDVMEVSGNSGMDPVQVVNQFATKLPESKVEEIGPRTVMLMGRPGESAGGGNHILIQILKVMPPGAKTVVFSHFEMSDDQAAMIKHQLRKIKFQ